MEALTRDVAVAKKQKNIALDEQLLELVDGIQKITGASVSRIVSAAILSFVFDNLRSESGHLLEDVHLSIPELFMSLAVEVDLGEIRVEDIPDKMLDSHLRRAAFLHDMAKRQSEKSKSTKPPGSLEHFEQLRSGAAKGLKKWEELVEMNGGKIQAILHRLGYGQWPAYGDPDSK